MLACICCGIVETGVVLIIISLFRPIYRFINWICIRLGCKCKCHHEKTEEKEQQKEQK
jgi:hypothetical protein